MFGFDPSSTLQYSEPEMRDSKHVVKISQAVRSKALALSDDSLIGQFHGPRPQLYLTKAVANNLGVVRWL